MNNKGVSEPFMLTVLLITGIIFSILLRMKYSNPIGCTPNSSSEQARDASYSGMITTVSHINTTDPQEQKSIVTKLNAFAAANTPDTISNSSLLWFAGGENSWEKHSSSEQYRVKMTAFNPETFEISLISEGKDRYGNRATSTALYALSGLGLTANEKVLSNDSNHDTSESGIQIDPTAPKNVPTKETQIALSGKRISTTLRSMYR